MIKLAFAAAITTCIIAVSTFGASAAIINQRGNTGHDYADSVETCGELDHMRSVDANDIRAVYPGQHIALIPVCEDPTIVSRNEFDNELTSLFNAGNVRTLRNPIAHSRPMMQALYARGYDQNDVISMRFGANDSILLYVHQRNMR